MAKFLNYSIPVIGRYELEEMTPNIEVAKNISNHLNIKVGYLLEGNRQSRFV
ncbi:hypothetical protein [Elizabethkingia argenteiflava]|uniref:hypothetical protein n=1 Tax=Elizabethkingia argenteiflava TaxID=2681556 RepID=UPI00159C1A91